MGLRLTTIRRPERSWALEQHIPPLRGIANLRAAGVAV
jgi:hypothetical protein